MLLHLVRSFSNPLACYAEMSYGIGAMASMQNVSFVYVSLFARRKTATKACAVSLVRPGLIDTILRSGRVSLLRVCAPLLKH